MYRWILLTGLTLVGCGRVAELQTYECTDCIVCETDASCVIAHNPCHEVAVCGHVDDQIVLTDDGCSPALEYATPAASECVCEQSQCEAVP